MKTDDQVIVLLKYTGNMITIYKKRKKIVQGKRNYAEITAFGEKNAHCWEHSLKEI